MLAQLRRSFIFCVMSMFSLNPQRQNLVSYSVIWYFHYHSWSKCCDVWIFECLPRHWKYKGFINSKSCWRGLPEQEDYEQVSSAGARSSGALMWCPTRVVSWTHLYLSHAIPLWDQTSVLLMYCIWCLKVPHCIQCSIMIRFINKGHFLDLKYFSSHSGQSYGCRTNGMLHWSAIEAQLVLWDPVWPAEGTTHTNSDLEDLNTRGWRSLGKRRIFSFGLSKSWRFMLLARASLR